MQSQSNRTPFYKQLRITTPERNWCINQSWTEEGCWTLERCIAESSHFLSREEWERESPVSYRKAIRRGWLTKCTAHIKDFKRKATVPAKWTLKLCLEAGNQCKTRTEFKKRFKYPYEKARLNGWLDICCAHMNQ